MGRSDQSGVFVGFGFGAIQGGLFAHEAYRSGCFRRQVIAEVRREVVEAVRRAGGCYRVNVATRHGLEVHEVGGVELVDPSEPGDRAVLIEAISQATEMATALPSVAAYDQGPAVLLAEGWRNHCRPCVLYAAENHTGAALELTQAIVRAGGVLPPGDCQIANTVIGKMSGVILDEAMIVDAGLAPIAEGLRQAFLVEEFNHILISRIHLPGYQRGLSAFEEKVDLLPFQQAKLYGHNAIHAVLGYLAEERGMRWMSEVAKDAGLMKFARDAFLEESGGAMIHRHGQSREAEPVDPLFTPDGWMHHADELLERMVNPWLRDPVERVIRDPDRKLAWGDRLIGTMRLALDAGITPDRFAVAAAAALRLIQADRPDLAPGQCLDSLWPEPDSPPGRKADIKRLILNADRRAT